MDCCSQLREMRNNAQRYDMQDARFWPFRTNSHQFLIFNTLHLCLFPHQMARPNPLPQGISQGWRQAKDFSKHLAVTQLRSDLLFRNTRGLVAFENNTAQGDNIVICEAITDRCLYKTGFRGRLQLVATGGKFRQLTGQAGKAIPLDHRLPLVLVHQHCYPAR